MSEQISKQEKRTEEKALTRRRRNILLVMGELILCLTLGIGAVFCARSVNQMHYEALESDVYKESIKAPTYTTKSVVDVTDEAGSVIGASEIEIPVDVPDGKVYRNILIVGVDSRSAFDLEELGTNTDVMIIASVNQITGEIKLVSVLRDTVLKMENSRRAAYDKANSQFYYGISDTVSMMNRNLGLDIEEYVIVNWYGVAVVVNQLGGVEITLADYKQCLWMNGYTHSVCESTGLPMPEEIWVPGTYILNGPQTVGYCRIRYGGLNDTGRTSNQRETINKMLEKAKSILKSGDVNTILNCAETALGNVKTNLKLPEILSLASDLTKYSITGSRQFPVDYTSGESVGNFIAKYGSDLNWAIVANDFEQEVKDLHAFLFDDTSYEPSAFIKEVSRQLYLDRTGQ